MESFRLKLYVQARVVISQKSWASWWGHLLVEYFQALQVVVCMFQARLLPNWGINSISHTFQAVHYAMYLPAQLSSNVLLYKWVQGLISCLSIALLARQLSLKSACPILGICSMLLTKGLFMPLLDLHMDIFRCQTINHELRHRTIDMPCLDFSHCALCILCLAGILSICLLVLVGDLLHHEPQPINSESRINVKQDLYFDMTILGICIMNASTDQSSVLAVGMVLASLIIWLTSKARAFHFTTRQKHRTLRRHLIGLTGLLLLISKFTKDRSVLNPIVSLMVCGIVIIITNFLPLDNRIELLAKDTKTLSGGQRTQFLLCLEYLWQFREQGLNQVWLDGHLALHRENPCSTPECCCSCAPNQVYPKGIQAYLSTQYHKAQTKFPQNVHLRLHYASFLIRHEGHYQQAVTHLNYVSEQNPSLRNQFTVYLYRHLIEQQSQAKYQNLRLRGEEQQYDYIREMRQRENHGELRHLLKREAKGVAECWRILLQQHPEKTRLFKWARWVVQWRLLRQKCWTRHLDSQAGTLGEKEYALMAQFHSLVLDQPEQAQSCLDRRDQRALSYTLLPFLHVAKGKIIDTNLQTASMLGYSKSALLQMQMDSLLISGQRPMDWSTLDWNQQIGTLYLVTSLGYVQEYIVQLSLIKPQESLVVFQGAPQPNHVKEALLVVNRSGEIMYMSQSCLFLLRIDYKFIEQGFDSLSKIFEVEQPQVGIINAHITDQACEHFSQDKQDCIPLFWQLNICAINEQCLLVRVTSDEEPSSVQIASLHDVTNTVAQDQLVPMDTSYSNLSRSWEFNYEPKSHNKPKSSIQSTIISKKVSFKQDQQRITANQKIGEKSTKIITLRLINNQLTCVDYLEQQRMAEEIEAHNRIQQEKQEQIQQQKQLYQDDNLSQLTEAIFHRELFKTGGLKVIKKLRIGLFFYWLALLTMMIISQMMTSQFHHQLFLHMDRVQLSTKREMLTQSVLMTTHTLLLAHVPSGASPSAGLDPLVTQLKEIQNVLADSSHDSAMLISRLSHLASSPLAQFSLQDPTVQQVLQILEGDYPSHQAQSSQKYLDSLITIMHSHYHSSQLFLILVFLGNCLAALLVGLLMRSVDQETDQVLSFFLLLPKKTLRLLLKKTDHFMHRHKGESLDQAASTEEEFKEEEEEEQKYLIPQKKH